MQELIRRMLSIKIGHHFLFAGINSSREQHQKSFEAKKNESETIKDIIIKDIRTIFGQESDYCKPIR